MFLGDDIIPWLMLAFGGAMLVGNVAAIARPKRTPTKPGELSKAPLRRAVPFALIGLVVTVWGFASLVT